MSKVYDVRKLFREDILNNILSLKTNLSLKFEDGVVLENLYYKDIIMFVKLLQFITNYDIKITSDLWIENYYTEIGGEENNIYRTKLFNKNVFKKLYNRVIQKITDGIPMEVIAESKLRERLADDMYKAIDDINATLVKNIVEYAVDVEVNDILDLQLDKEIFQTMLDVKENPTPSEINKAYKKVDEVIVKSGRFLHNPLAFMYQIDAVNRSQVHQLLTARGYVTELNSLIFKHPITNSFTIGMRDLADYGIESRAGAKALYFTNKAIPMSEFMARGLQLAAMLIEKIEYGDCGCPTYVDFYVKPDVVNENGEIVEKNDLRVLIGKRYWDEETASEKVITEKDKHLIGKTIKLRQALYCGLSDKKKICSSCIGNLSFGIFKHQNLGHAAVTEATSQITQNLLSAKHHLVSAVAANIILSPSLNKVFINRNNKLYFRASFFKKNRSYYLKVPQHAIPGYSYIKRVKNILNININNVSKVYEASIIEVDKNGKKVGEYPIKLKVGKHIPYFSELFINYIIKSDIEVLREDYFIIPLDNWNKKLPVLVYTDSEFDFEALAKEFEKLIKTRKTLQINGKLKSDLSPHILVQKLHEIVNKKLNINIALIEILVYAFTVYDLTSNNLDLGRNSKEKDLIGYKRIDTTIGSGYNWNNLQSKIVKPYYFDPKNKIGHPLDVLFKPKEVVEKDNVE